MKIGTITFWYSKENYGAMLQCYALLKYLNQHGHDAKLIKAEVQPWSDIKFKYFYKMTNFLTDIFHPTKQYRNNRKDKRSSCLYKPVDRCFSNFLDSYIPAYDQIYTYKDLNNNCLDVDAIIVGSDQVWGGFSNTYFLNFKGRFKRISYAASFGGAKYENPFIRRKIKKWLKRFDMVTVREYEGLEKCQQMGIHATLVPDPTLLLHKDDYCEIADTNMVSKKEPYLFLYLLGKSISIEVKEIIDFANKNHFKVIYVASQGRSDEFDKTFPTVEKWLAMVRDAKCVITNSFHGTALSIVFEKPFLTIPLTGADSRMNGRIETMLEKYQLRDRIYTGDLNNIFHAIDYSYCNNIRKKEEMQVMDILSTVLTQQ